MQQPHQSNVSSASFYSRYHGHPPNDLKTLLSVFPTPRIYLAGDSTLDNKYWLSNHTRPSPPPYNTILTPPNSLPDVAYWLTTLAPTTYPYPAINCAIEATTLRARQCALLQQDKVIRDNITENDILIVSVGGNDIALRPSLRIVFAVLANVYLGGTIGLATLESVLVRRAERYIARLVVNRKPRLVLVCGLYYMDEAPVPSWAGFVLRVLGYNSRPRRVQMTIDRVFQRMERISVDGVRVIPVPLSHALDGKDTRDYVARVEPSEQGGEKIARLFWRVILRELGRRNSDG